VTYEKIPRCMEYLGQDPIHKA